MDAAAKEENDDMNENLAVACQRDLPDGRRIWIPPTGRPFWCHSGQSVPLTDQEIDEFCDTAIERYERMLAENPALKAADEEMNRLMGRCGKWFILDENNQPVQERSCRKWCWWKSTNQSKCVVGQEKVGKLEVSTVFIGHDLDRQDHLWETMIFGRDTEHTFDRYRTFEEAKIGHEAAKAWAKEQGKDSHAVQ